MIEKACSYKSIIQWNALENQMRSICDTDPLKSHSGVLLSHIYCKYVVWNSYNSFTEMNELLLILLIAHDHISFAELF